MNKVLFLLLVLIAPVMAEELPMLRGEVTPYLAKEIIDHFDAGAPIFIGDAILRRLPKKLGSKIWRISLEDGIYTVEIETENCSPNYEIFKVKNVCKIGGTCNYRVEPPQGCISEVAL